MKLKTRVSLSIICAVIIVSGLLFMTQTLVSNNFRDNVLYEQADELYQSVIGTVVEQGKYLDDYVVFLELRAGSASESTNGSRDSIIAPEIELLYNMAIRDPSRYVLMDLNNNMVRPQYRPRWLGSIADIAGFYKDISEAILDNRTKLIYFQDIISEQGIPEYPDILIAWLLPRNGYVLIERVRMDQTRIRVLYLREQARDATRRLLLFQAAIIVFFAITLAVLFSLLMHRTVLKPIELLTSIVNNMRQGDNSKRFSARAQDEIRDLGVAFNSMQDNIVNYQNRLEQMISTHVNELEEARRQAAFGSMMAAGVAHDIKGPLGSLNTALSFLDMQLKEFSQAYQDESLTRKQTSSFLDTANEGFSIMQIALEKAINLSRSFKDVVADQLKSNVRIISLDAYISDIVLSYRFPLRKAGVNVEVNILPDTKVQIDPGALSQILINLMENSLVHGFSADDEQNNMEYDPVITINALINDHTVVMDYQDNGIGLSDSSQQNLFKKMYSSRTAEGGTGYGMMLIQELATIRLKGAIEYIDESRRDTNSCGVHFRLCFPVGLDTA